MPPPLKRERERVRRAWAAWYDAFGWTWPIWTFGIIWIVVMVKFS